MRLFSDQIGKKLKFEKTPARIVSIVPSQTELICDLGLSKQLVGVTKFCVHPKRIIQNKSKVGGTKKIDINKVKLLSPDIIIANKEENEKGQVEELENICPVWTSDIHNLNDAIHMISALGEILGAEKKSNEIIEKIESGFREYDQKRNLWRREQLKLSAAYLIWRKPYMVAGGDSFINCMMEVCGFENAFADCLRYPEKSLDELKNCDVLLLSSEPFPFQQKHIEELKKNFAELGGIKSPPKIVLVDGEIFSWYGSRIALAPSYFEALMQNFVAL
ncbi:MAG: cobalamin-binding protein [Bacteroidetes bacterium]|nr:MAG: cobalamin-binding protein [Bacteroidota bacterium]